MSGNNTTATDVSIDNLNTHVSNLTSLLSEHQTEINEVIDDISEALANNKGTAASELEELNSYITSLKSKLIALITTTRTTVSNIAYMFAEEDKKNAEAASSSYSGD